MTTAAVRAVGLGAVGGIGMLFVFGHGGWI
jgi:preprotein translocase subunit Sss1